MSINQIQRGTKLIDATGNEVGMILGFDCTVHLPAKTLNYWHVDVDNDECSSMEVQYILCNYTLA